MEALYGCAPFWERLFGAYLLPPERVAAALAWPLLRRHAPSCGARPRLLTTVPSRGGLALDEVRALVAYTANHGSAAHLQWVWRNTGHWRDGRGVHHSVSPWDVWVVSRLVGERGDVAVAAVLVAFSEQTYAIAPLMRGAAECDRAALLHWCLYEFRGRDWITSTLHADCMNAACSRDAVASVRALHDYYATPTNDHMHMRWLRRALESDAPGVLDFLHHCCGTEDAHARTAARISPRPAARVMAMVAWAWNRPRSLAWLGAQYNLRDHAATLIANNEPVDGWLIATARCCMYAVNPC